MKAEFLRKEFVHLCVAKTIKSSCPPPASFGLSIRILGEAQDVSILFQTTATTALYTNIHYCELKNTKTLTTKTKILDPYVSYFFNVTPSH